MTDHFPPDAVMLPGADQNRVIPPRTTEGKFIRTDESLRRDAEALRLRSRGMSFQAISDQLGYGGCSNARRAIMRATDDIIGEPVRDLVQQQVELLDMLTAKAIAVLEREHITVSHGRVIRIGPAPEDGEPDTRQPLLDDGPVLQAINTLKSLSESRRKLFGLDAPQKIDATVHEVTQEDLAISELIRDARARNALDEQQLRSDA